MPLMGYTHPAFSKVPQSFPMTSLSIFLRNPWLSSPCWCKQSQRIFLKINLFLKIINRFRLQALPSVSVCPSPVNRFVKHSPLPASAPPLIGWQLAWIWCWTSQCRDWWQGGTFPTDSITAPSTSVSMVKDLDTSWKMHFQEELWGWWAARILRKSVNCFSS